MTVCNCWHVYCLALKTAFWNKVGESDAVMVIDLQKRILCIVLVLTYHTVYGCDTPRFSTEPVPVMLVPFLQGNFVTKLSLQ